MTKSELKRQVWEAIDRRAEEIIGIGERIRTHPELGFKEVRTAALVADTLGPTVAVLGELDALVVAGHPEGDPASGAAHACDHYREIGHRTGSTDMEELSQVMPVLHPYVGGARGTGHAADYEIVDTPLAYVVPAKALAAMVIDLLADGAAGAREVLGAARPPMTREQYLAFQRGLARHEVYEG